MEKRVKAHKLDLSAKSCSSSLFNTDTLRFYFATFAYVLLERLRQALAGTRLTRIPSTGGSSRSARGGAPPSDVCTSP